MSKGNGKRVKINSSLLTGKLMVLIALLGGIIIGTYATIFTTSNIFSNAEENKGASTCSKSTDCVVIEGAKNKGTFTAPRPIDHIVIKAGVNFYTVGIDENDGEPGYDPTCYLVDINGYALTWKKLRNSNTCKDISHIQVWLQQDEDEYIEPTPTEEPDY